jgi:FMN reductase
MRLSIVVGNPKKGSRTLQVAECLAERVVAATGATSLPPIDLIDYGSVLFDWPNDELAHLNQSVRGSDLLIVASPTYKASYTGLLKAFLDRYPSNGLAGVTAIPVMTASSLDHSLAVEFTLRPLLVELGASVPTRGLSFYMPEMGRIDDVLDKWAAANLATPGIFAPSIELLDEA